MVKYRLCAAAVVFNKEGKVLLGNRIDTTDKAWQFPQGGIEKGETPKDAAKRELFEETGIVSVKTIYTDVAPLRYDFPKDIKEKFRHKNINTDGQDVFFSLFYFEGKDNEINLNTATPEFCEYTWEDFDFAVKHIVDFKKEVYQKAFQKLTPLIEQYINTIS